MAFLREHRRRVPTQDVDHSIVIGAGGEAVFVLRCPNGPPKLRDSYGFSRQEVGRILGELAVHLPPLCQRWREIHGDF